MADNPHTKTASPDKPTQPEGRQPNQQERRPANRSGGRQRKGGRVRSAYTFPDDLERCFCRNARHILPEAFPVSKREGVARPAMVELARTDSQVLFCDLLHEGPHMWPNGDEFSGS